MSPGEIVVDGGLTALASLENGLSLTDTEMKAKPRRLDIDSQCILELKDVTLRFGGGSSAK